MSPEERRAAIVEATAPLVIEHGATVTTRLIAEAAGVAEGTIFRVFADKRALFYAVAEHVMNPPGSSHDMAVQLEGLTDLHDKVVRVVTRMQQRSYRVMTVMVALRTVLINEGPPTHGPGEPPGPPQFVIDAHQQLLHDLTELLFAPHAAELRVSPEDAAITFRALVLGSQHPGMYGAERHLTPEQVADVVLHGIAKGDE